MSKRRRSPSTWLSLAYPSVAPCDCAAEDILLRNIIGELGFPHIGPTPTLTDATGVQGIVITPAPTCRTQHIEVHYHYVRYHVARNRFVPRRVDTSKTAGDDLTKPLPRVAHKNAWLKSACPHATQLRSIDVRLLQGSNRDL